LGQERQEAFNKEVSEGRKQRQGEMQRWAVIGPFDNRNRTGLGREYPPEAEFSFDKSYPGKNGKVNWEPATVWSADSYRVSLGNRWWAVIGPFNEWTVAYAYTQLYSPKETETQFKLTCQQGCRLWLEGKEIVHSEVPGPNENTVAPVRLHPGWNPVLVKVDRTQMLDSFLVLDVRSGSGEVIPELKFDFAGESAKLGPPADSVPRATKP
jgi:hypothetical protein